MSLDPIREARVRRMLFDQSTWPNPRVLPMKRIMNNGNGSFGVIKPPVNPNDIRIITYDGQPFEQFENIEELIAAGWTVD